MGSGLSSLRMSVNGLKAGIAERVNAVNADALSVEQCEKVKKALLRIAQQTDDVLKELEDSFND